MSKDVLIAGGIVVACLGLVTLAFLPSKDKPSSDPGLSAPIGGGGDLGMGPIGAAPGGRDQYGPPPAPVGGDGFGPNPGGGFNPGPSPTPSPVPAPLPPSPGPVVGGGDAGGFNNDPFAPLPSVGGAPVGGGPVVPGPGPDLGGGFPAPTPAPVAQAEPSPAPATGEQSHVVGKGETLGDISTKYYGSSKHWKKIQAANPGLKPENMKLGETIVIPALAADGGGAAGGGTAGAPGTYTLKPGDSYYTIAKRQLGSAARWRELEQLNGIPAEELRAGQTIKLPAKDGAPEQAAAASGGKVHVVRKGETLGDISKDFYGTTTKWRKIIDANPGLAPERLKVGQRIVIPPAPAAVPGSVTEDGKYVVKAGDNLGTIAQQQLGTAKAWKKILDANPGIDPKGLRVGQQLRIPGGAKHAGGAAAPDATAPAGGGQPGEPGLPGGPAPVPGVPPPPPAPTYRDDPFFDPYLTVPAPAQATPAVPAGPTTPSPGFPGEGLR